MTFDPIFLSNLLLVLTAFGGAFLAALWIALVIWTYRDIRARARLIGVPNPQQVVQTVLLREDLEHQAVKRLGALRAGAAAPPKSAAVALVKGPPEHWYALGAKPLKVAGHWVQLGEPAALKRRARRG